MQGNILVETFEERDAITDQDGHDRIADLVGEPEAKAFTSHRTTANQPDAAEGRLQSLVHQPGQISRVELDAVPGPRQIATGEDEGRLVAVRPAQPLGFERQCGFVGSRSHHVAVDRCEELRDELRGHGVAAFELVRGLEPVHGSVPSSDEAVETRHHVDRDAGVRHRFLAAIQAR